MTQECDSGSASIVCFGEVLLRLASPQPSMLLQEMRLEATFCGAEANVAVALAGFGHSCRMVTSLPANPIGDAAARTLASFGVELAGPRPAGKRMGLYFLQPGAMSRPSSIVYDRAGSAFAMTSPVEHDWSAHLAGAQWLFISGITPALGQGPREALLQAVAVARKQGVRIAFDTNFRPTLWQGREAEAAQVLREISLEADLVFAGRRAIAMMAGGDYDLPDPCEGFHAAAKALFALSPHLSHVAATRREVRSTDSQRITALLADRDGSSTSPTIALDNIVDRVGTGDAFAAGIVHGLARGLGRSKTVCFAAACSQWAHSVPGDFLRASVADIEAIAAGGGDVRR